MRVSQRLVINLREHSVNLWRRQAWGTRRQQLRSRSPARLRSRSSAGQWLFSLCPLVGVTSRREPAEADSVSLAGDLGETTPAATRGFLVTFEPTRPARPAASKCFGPFSFPRVPCREGGNLPGSVIIVGLDHVVACCGRQGNYSKVGSASLSPQKPKKKRKAEAITIHFLDRLKLSSSNRALRLVRCHLPEIKIVVLALIGSS